MPSQEELDRIEQEAALRAEEQARAEAMRRAEASAMARAEDQMRVRELSRMPSGMGLPSGPMSSGPEVAPEGQRLAVLRTNVPGQGQFERRFAYTPPPPPDPMEILSRRLLQQFQNLPIQQSQAAIEAAVKFQGLTGYRKALEKGESPVTAFQKYGPMLFFSNLGAFGGAARNMAAAFPQPYSFVRGQNGAPDYFNTQGKPTFVPNTAPTSVREVDEIQRSEEAARQAEAMGNTAMATQLRDRAMMLRNKLNKQEEITGYGPDGNPIFTMKKGGGGATIATQTKAQDKLTKYESAVELINQLQGGLAKGHVGIAGVGGEYLWDRGLTQLGELAGINVEANKDRVTSRTGLRMLKESLMREISNDTRFSNADREEISRALPSTGIYESTSDAHLRLNIVRDLLQKRGKVYSSSVGGSPPLWSLSPEEIKAQFKSGKITESDALDALQRFH